MSGFSVMSEAAMIPVPGSMVDQMAKFVAFPVFEGEHGHFLGITDETCGLETDQRKQYLQ
jgi:hypothetical protein